jgi:hypothetical protein
LDVLQLLEKDKNNPFEQSIWKFVQKNWKYIDFLSFIW